ncbi:MAG: flagellar biosynthetic protein FliQ [Nannocystaceae bacterium]|nr:flagellar biosynthetic protein FliQ [bacterium]
MSGDPMVLELLYGAIMTAAKISVPILAASLIVGLVTALLQAATQLQENVISFVPKLVIVGLTLVVSGEWMLATLTDYGRLVIQRMGELGTVPGAMAPSEDDYE